MKDNNHQLQEDENKAHIRQRVSTSTIVLVLKSRDKVETAKVSTKCKETRWIKPTNDNWNQEYEALHWWPNHRKESE